MRKPQPRYGWSQAKADELTSLIRLKQQALEPLERAKRNSIFPWEVEDAYVREIRTYSMNWTWTAIDGYLRHFAVIVDPCQNNNSVPAMRDEDYAAYGRKRWSTYRFEIEPHPEHVPDEHVAFDC